MERDRSYRLRHLTQAGLARRVLQRQADRDVALDEAGQVCVTQGAQAAGQVGGGQRQSVKQAVRTSGLRSSTVVLAMARVGDM